MGPHHGSLRGSGRGRPSAAGECRTDVLDEEFQVGAVGPSGEHQLEISVIGKLESGKDFARTEQFTFRKDIEPRLLGIAVAGSGQPSIELRDW